MVPCARIIGERVALWSRCWYMGGWMSPSRNVVRWCAVSGRIRYFDRVFIFDLFFTDFFRPLDLDQLQLIISVCGPMPKHLVESFRQKPEFYSSRIPEPKHGKRWNWRKTVRTFYIFDFSILGVNMKNIGTICLEYMLFFSVWIPEL